MSVDIFYAVLDYIPLSDNYDLKERIIMQFASLNLLVANVLTCMEQREKRDGCNQEVRLKILAGRVSEEVDKLTGQLCKSLQITEPEKLELPSEVTETDLKEG